MAGLLEDTLEIYDLVIELLGEEEDAGVPLEDTLAYEAFTKLYTAAKKLSRTTLAELKEEGLQTSLSAGDPPGL